MKGQGKIKYWFTRNGVHVPVYEKQETKKIGKVIAANEGLGKRNPKVTSKTIFDTIDELEQKAAKTDLNEAAITRLYKQADKTHQKLMQDIHNAHALEDMDKLRTSQQRLEKLMKKLNNDYHNNQW